MTNTEEKKILIGVANAIYDFNKAQKKALINPYSHQNQVIYIYWMPKNSMGVNQ